MKTRYMISCAVAAVLSSCAGASFAADAAATTTAKADDGVAVQEVVVTAERREQTVQKVPMTLQAFSGASLSELNVTDFQELLHYTPNVTYSGGGAGQGNVFMRGLSGGSAGNQSSAAVGNFPNVAIYLDDQSMQFPGRNVDIFMADMERVEVLEGPQGTLFGGGAEAGAIRYITNKPKLDVFQGRAEGGYGVTEGGDNNTSFNIMLNLPLVQDKLAVRVVAYSDRQGGYINSVASNFTRKDSDDNTYVAVAPLSSGKCADGGLPSKTSGSCTSPTFAVTNNNGMIKNAQNPLTHEGLRVSALWAFNADWDLLVTESVQNMDAEGISQEYPQGSDGQTLKPLQVTAFSPSWDRDDYENTAWTVNGKVGDLKVVYTGAFMERYVNQQVDYTNYSRTLYGQYYECTGGSNPSFGPKTASPTCYSPVTSWNDKARNTHLTQEIRLATPSDWKLRGVGGVFYENFQIYDVMNFNYKTIPACDAGNNLATALAGGAVCLGNNQTYPGATSINPGVRGDSTGFGEDVTRGYDQSAVFGQADYDILPNLTLTLGGRYFQYNETEKGSKYATNGACVDVLVCGLGSLTNIDAEHEKASYSGFKGRAEIQWHPTESTLVYALYSQGFRPGGFSRSSKTTALLDASGTPGNYKQYVTPLSYKPDSLTNEEIGLKTQFFEKRLLVNLSAYHMYWQNVQFAIYNPTQLFNNTFLVNGPSYNINGAEAQFTGRLYKGLTLNGSVSYNDDRQANSPCLVANNPGVADFGQCITQIKGQPFQNPMGQKGGVAAFSPPLQANLRVRYEWETNGYKAFASLGGAYTSHYYNEPSSYVMGTDANLSPPNTTFLRFRMAPYATSDASIGFKRDNWTVSIDASNLLNSHASTYTNTNQFIKEETPLRPRVVMMKVAETF